MDTCFHHRERVSNQTNAERGYCNATLLGLLVLVLAVKRADFVAFQSNRFKSIEISPPGKSGRSLVRFRNSAFPHKASNLQAV